MRGFCWKSCNSLYLKLRQIAYVVLAQTFVKKTYFSKFDGFFKKTNKQNFQIHQNPEKKVLLKCHIGSEKRFSICFFCESYGLKTTRTLLPQNRPYLRNGALSPNIINQIILTSTFTSLWENVTRCKLLYSIGFKCSYL